MNTIPISCRLLPLILFLVSLQPASAFYDPGAQRWLNRDPIEERGSGNLFQFCEGAASGTIDVYGLFGAGRPPNWRPPAPLHSPKGQENYCPPRPPCLGHNNFPGGVWDGNGGSFDYSRLDRWPTLPFPFPWGGRPDLHFLPLSRAEQDAANAILTCDGGGFETAMHEGQDYFSHVHSWPTLMHPILPFVRYPGCHWNPPNFEFGHWLWLDLPDRNMDAWGLAADWTEGWLRQWRAVCEH
jgi:hypothetical protein